MDDAAKPSWISRNIGCVIAVAIVAPLLICGGCFASIFTIVFGAMKASEPYQVAVSRAKENAEVKQLLGTPIEEGWLTSGSINLSGNSGNADLQIPISGPKGSATVSVVGTKSAGNWKYTFMLVDSPALEESIDLLDKGP